MITGERPNVTATRRYNIKETAEVLGVHRNTVARWIDGGQLRTGMHKKTLHKYVTGLEILKFWNS